jgi:hypothetical protein
MFFILTTINIIYQIILLMQNMNEAHRIITSIVVQVVTVAIFTIHYLLTRRISNATSTFACFQSIIVTIGIFEGSMLGDKLFVTPDGVLQAMALVACLSTISHSQRDLLLSYITACLYSIVRTYFWIGQNDILRFVKFNISVITAFIMFYVFSRVVHQT